MTTIAAGRFTLAVEFTRTTVYLRVGCREVFAEHWPRAVPFAIARPGPGERVMDLGRWRFAATNFRRFEAAQVCQ